MKLVIHGLMFLVSLMVFSASHAADFSLCSLPEMDFRTCSSTNFQEVNQEGYSSLEDICSGPLAVQSFVSCVNNNFETIGEDLNIVLNNCYNTRTDEITLAFSYCVNRRFSKIQKKVTERGTADGEKLAANHSRPAGAQMALEQNNDFVVFPDLFDFGFGQ